VAKPGIDLPSPSLKQHQEGQARTDAQRLQVKGVDAIDGFPGGIGQPLEGGHRDSHPGEAPWPGGDSEKVELVDLDPGETKELRQMVKETSRVGLDLH